MINVFFDKYHREDDTLYLDHNNNLVKDISNTETEIIELKNGLP